MVLRLRGGGGAFNADALNTTTQEKVSIKSINHHESFNNLQEKIAAVLKCKSDRIILTELNGKAIEKDYDENDSLFDFVKDYPSYVNISFMLSLDFREIVTAFNSTGIMSEKLIKFLSVQSVDELREKQTDDKVKAVSDEVLITLIAIKILNDHYKPSKKLWNLVEKKSRKAAIAKLSITGKELSAYLSEVENCFSKSQIYDE